VNAVEVNAILHDIAFGNGIFAAVGYDGVIMSSVDGEHWETKVEALRYDLTNIVCTITNLLPLVQAVHPP